MSKERGELVKMDGEKILVISCCSSGKDDSIPISEDSEVIQPRDYLKDKELLSELKNLRETIFEKENAEVGDKETYAFDLYGRAGYAYKDLRESSNYKKLKSELTSSDKINWFFLSGGYGIVNALEPAKKYQATFTRSISYKNDIPYTTDLWGDFSPKFCDSIFSNLAPDWVYIFGSRDYTSFIKQTQFWEEEESIRMFESYGSAGVYWRSSKINNLADKFLDDNLSKINKKYLKFTQQE